MSDAGDVWINATPKRHAYDGPTRESSNDIVVLAWKRLVDTGNSRRGADGLASVVVMSTVDFFQLAGWAADRDVAFVVECKATERLNVTRTLYWAWGKLARWKLGKTA